MKPNKHMDHRGVLLYEMLFATTPFTGRCIFFGGGRFFLGGKLQPAEQWKGQTHSGWWFQIFFIFIPTWGNNPIWLIWLIFFRWVETTNQRCLFANWIMFDSISQVTVNQLKTGGWYPSFATFPKHHQKEQFSGGQVGFPALWMLVNHPQLHSPVGRSSSSDLLTMLLAVIFAQQMKSAVG